jgi:predicted TIM-barrel fold metal-dependent hydrolase
MMNRRDILNLAVTAGAATAMFPSTARTADDEKESPPFRIVDTNVSLFQWPFRRLPLDDADTLAKKLHLLGIDQAWAGSFEGILQRDIASVNQRLADACRKRPALIPIGSVNPELPGWEDDLRRCVDDHNMPGIRLHPNYHGYTLDDPRFARVLKLATAAGRFVQLAVAIEDTRTQHLQLQVADVDLAPLAEVVRGVPQARVQILNYRPRPTALGQLATTPGVFFDTARVESTDGVPKLMENVPPGRVLFGTHAPFLIPEAALIRVHESGLLDDKSLRAVFAENADHAFGNPTA